MKDDLFKTTGIFSLPGKNTVKSYGDLKIAKHIELNLLEALPDEVLEKQKTRIIKEKDNEPEYNFVIGNSPDGFIVLHKKHFGRNMKFKGDFNSTSEKFTYALISDQDFSQNLANISFETIEIKLIRTNDFIKKSNITGKIKSDSNNRLLSLSINFDLRNLILHSFETSEYKIAFLGQYKHNLRADDPIRNHYPAEETPIINISKKLGTFSVEEVNQIALSIRNFMAFALREPLFWVELIGINNCTVEREIIKAKTKLFFSGTYYEEITKSSRRLLFNLKDTKRSLGKYFERWLNSEKQYKKLHNNFFRNVYATQYWESMFLSYVTGLEQYIDTEFKAQIVKKKNGKYKNEMKKIEPIISNLPNTTVGTYMKSKLGEFKSSVNLKMKLSSFRVVLPKNLKKYLTDDDIELIVKTRNTLAHEGVSTNLRKQILNSEILGKLHRMSEVCLLRSIGMPLQIIEEVINSSI